MASSSSSSSSSYSSSSYSSSNESIKNHNEGEKAQCDLYIVYNPTCLFRKRNMERRLQTIGIQRYHFVEGGSSSSDLVEHYHHPKHGKGPAGCLIGHLRALRTFIDIDEKSFGCILEDDVLFRDDFISKLNEYIVKYSEQPLIQLFCISGAIDKSCCYGLFGTQGYLISRSYAKRALKLYDRPTRYWPVNQFPTSEAITMYSNGVCVARNPIIIEDSQSYTLFGHVNVPSEKVPYQIYSYSFGLERYIDCDPEFTFGARNLLDLWYYLIRMKRNLLTSLLKRCRKPDKADCDNSNFNKTDSNYVDDIEWAIQDQWFIYHLLHMFAFWGIDNNLAQKHADDFFRLIAIGDRHYIIYMKWVMVEEITSFYQPSFKEKFPIQLDNSYLKEDGTLDLNKISTNSRLNWLRVPNSPYRIDNKQT